jgi:phage regulator Rha-like protein
MSSRLVVASGPSEPTMSSREIAELVGALHHNVRACIELLMEKGVINSYVRHTYSTGRRGRPGYEYRVCKPDSFVIFGGSP